ncbi:hypothetical protein [Inquilinus limosus]|uniref:Uncharacterized protein n=1 Tax=Inquilinus limosus MP06 TaxID=1398085 RepID=A0A0A0D941_9PROT|nr:hypothetical protein [Inquilinus limosus]KGM34580.1 hypothetical protein P409_09455 [Inquilinus limosus MP06]
MRQTIEDACRDLGVETPERIGGQLPPEDLKRLLRDQPDGIHLWITDVFHEVVDRIPPERCFRFWKAEVRSRLMEDCGFARELWPDGYAYLAQQWVSPYREPLVELMRCD